MSVWHQSSLCRNGNGRGNACGSGDGCEWGYGNVRAWKEKHVFSLATGRSTYQVGASGVENSEQSGTSVIDKALKGHITRDIQYHRWCWLLPEVRTAGLWVRTSGMVGSASEVLGNREIVPTKIARKWLFQYTLSRVSGAENPPSEQIKHVGAYRAMQRGD